LRVLVCALAAALLISNPDSLAAQGNESQVSEKRPLHTERLAQGTFRDGDSLHRGSGQLQILEAADGQTIARLENLKVVPGPNLLVYLVREPDPLFPEDVTAGFVSLGALKGLAGDQNYPVPKHVAIEDWGSLVVWCDTFKVAFAVATIDPL